MEQVQPAQEHELQPEQHNPEGTVLTPERHTKVPLEHRPVHTRRERHSLEPSVHMLVHTPRQERHSLV